MMPHFAHIAAVHACYDISIKYWNTCVVHGCYRSFIHTATLDLKTDIRKFGPVRTLLVTWPRS